MSLVVNAQNRNNKFHLPNKVMESYNKHFKGFKIYNVSVKEHSKNFLYEIETYSKRKKIRATFNVKGKLLILSKQIDKKELPAAVISALNKKFKSYILASIFKVTGQINEYDIILFYNNDEFNVHQKPNGQIILKKQIIEKAEEGC